MEANKWLELAVSPCPSSLGDLPLLYTLILYFHLKSTQTQHRPRQYRINEQNYIDLAHLGPFHPFSRDVYLLLKNLFSVCLSVCLSVSVCLCLCLSLSLSLFLSLASSSFSSSFACFIGSFLIAEVLVL